MTSRNWLDFGDYVDRVTLRLGLWLQLSNFQSSALSDCFLFVV